MSKRGLTALTATLGSIVLAWTSAALLIDHHGSRHPPSGQWDAIIVPGARVMGDGSLSTPLRNRTLKAIELWRSGVAPRIAISGGQCRGAPRTQADAAAELAIANGVPPEALVLEDQAASTEENAAFTASLLPVERVLVVTDSYHVLRCELVFRRYFTQVTGVGISPPMKIRVKMAVREVAALAAYLVTGRLHPRGLRS